MRASLASVVALVLASLCPLRSAAQCIKPPSGMIARLPQRPYQHVGYADMMETLIRPTKGGA